MVEPYRDRAPSITSTNSTTQETINQRHRGMAPLAVTFTAEELDEIDAVDPRRPLHPQRRNSPAGTRPRVAVATPQRRNVPESIPLVENRTTGGQNHINSSK